MILTPTTFIVGAGASTGSRIPTASDIYRHACNLTPQRAEYQLLRLAGVADVATLNQVIADLSNHPTADSIDAFLQQRQHDPTTVKVAKALLALSVGRAIAAAREDNLSRNDDDWMKVLLKVMVSGTSRWEEFIDKNRGVRFVTFNFDTLIEARLDAGVRGTYPNVSDDGMVEIEKAFSVLHVHGWLPSPPRVPMNVDPVGGVHQEWCAWVLKAVEAVRVVQDEIDEQTLGAAREAVFRSSILCFLGFAYDRENLKRLGLVPTPQPYAEFSPNIFGTAYGLRAGRREWVLDRFPSRAIALGPKESKCSDLLQDFHIFRD